jgi:hypothetical protein
MHFTRARLSQNPSKAAEYLEKWKDDLGDGYYVFKNKIDAEVEKQEFENLITEAAVKYPGLFNSQEDWIKKQKGIDSVTKKRAINIVRSNEAEQKRRTNEYEAEQRQEFEDAFYKDIREGNYVGAIKKLQDVPDRFVDQKSKFLLEEALNSKMQSETTKDDEEVKDDWWQQIQLDPQNVDRVALIEDERILSRTKDWLLGELDTSAGGTPKDPFRLVEAKDVLKSLDSRLTNNMYDDEYNKNRIGWMEDRRAFLSWMQENPDKSPSEWYKERFKEDIKPSGGFWNDVFTAITGNVTQFDSISEVAKSRSPGAEFAKRNPEAQPKTIVRRGTIKSGPNAGKKIIEYSDGSREIEESQIKFIDEKARGIGEIP